MRTGQLIQIYRTNNRRGFFLVLFCLFFNFLCCFECNTEATELTSLSSVVIVVSEHTQFTVWTGDLVKGDRVLFQVSLRSFSPPFLPHKL